MTGTRRDSLRRALQTALAGTLAYFAERSWGGGEGFLAVISAALVIDTNSDQTLEQGRARMLATLVGSGLGIAVLAVFPDSATYVALALVLAVMAGIAAYRPVWSYGIVAACALAMGSGEDLWGVALNRAIAIAIGAGIGIVSAFTIWPESAQQRVRRAVCEALESCSLLLDSTVETVAAQGRRNPAEHHRRFSGQISAARNSSAAIRVGSDGDAENYSDLVDRADRLWHALIILDRVGEGQDGDRLDMADETQDAVQELRRVAGEGLATLAKFEPVEEACLDELGDVLQRARTSVTDAIARGEGESEEDLRVSALIFGLDETIGNLIEISRAIERIRTQ